MYLPERSPEDRYVVKYSNALERGYLNLLFLRAVESVDRDKKEMIISTDYQTVRALTRAGHNVHPAPTQQPPA